MPSPEITPAEVFSHELRATRERKGWTQHQLAQELQRLDYHMVRSQITKIESGQRKATLDDVLAIALALGVPPLALVIPRNDAGSVRLAGNVTMSAPTAIAWWREVDVLSRGDAQSERFFYDSMPDRLAQLTREVPEIVAIFRTVTEFGTSEDSPNAGSVLLMIRAWPTALLPDTSRVGLQRQRSERNRSRRRILLGSVHETQEGRRNELRHQAKREVAGHSARARRRNGPTTFGSRRMRNGGSTLRALRHRSRPVGGSVRGQGSHSVRTPEQWRSVQVHRPSSSVSTVETYLRRHVYPRVGDRPIGGHPADRTCNRS